MMKLTIIALLAFCAIAAYSSPVPETGDYFETLGFRQKIDELIEKAKETYKSAVEKVSGYAKNVQEQLKNLVNKEKEKLQPAYERVKQKLDEIKKGVQHDMECAKKYEPEFDKARDGAEDEFNKCYDKAVESGKHLKDDVSGDLEVIKKNYNEFSEQTNKCLSFNPIKVAKCVYDKWDQFKANLTEIRNASKNVYDKSVKDGSELVKTATECYKIAYNKANENVKTVDENIEHCVKELKSN